MLQLGEAAAAFANHHGRVFQIRRWIREAFDARFARFRRQEFRGRMAIDGASARFLVTRLS